MAEVENMAKVEIQYPWKGPVEIRYRGNDVAVAIQRVRAIFEGSATASMPAGFVILEHNDSRVVFPTDGGVSFHYWENNTGKKWGSQEEFLRGTGRMTTSSG